MKNVLFLFMALAVVTFSSCSDSSGDEPTPTPENYTIIYKVVSTGAIIDTIMYLDVNGVEKYVYGQTQFEHSFVQPSNNYHAKFYMRGELNDFGFPYCEYTVAAMAKDSSYPNYYNSRFDNPGYTFKKDVEFSNSSN